MRPVTKDAQYKGQQGILHDAKVDGGQGVFRDAEKEQSYYLQQLFMHYGQNGTLSFHGLTNLLENLGLGQVQVVEIQHEDIGHGHVSHLDILEVQEQKHVHSHSSLEHAGETDINTTSRSQAVKIWTKRTTAKPEKTHIVQMTAEAGRELANSSNAWNPQSWSRPEQVQVGHHWARNNIIEKLLLLDHSNYSHLHGDCLNVTQLLLNFGLSDIEELTPQHFSLICPALLYQIDSRVCIRHDDVLGVQQEKAVWDMAVVGFGFLAITIISVPSLLAILLVPFLRRSVFRVLLAFLVALAVGTLCGDALLHLLPHAQGMHHKVVRPRQVEAPEDSILKGLCVMAGIYLLFLIENILGLTKLNPKKKKAKRDYSGSEQASLGALRALGSTEAEQEFPSSLDLEAGGTERVHHSSLLAHTEPEQEQNITVRSTHTSTEDAQFHLGHSHGSQQAGAARIADVAWMVILGDGIHNFTDGLAIGAAFSQGIPSGLSTSIAVFCHELPHELGDFAVLLQAGMPVRRVMVFSLLSAFLGYLGMLVGTTVSQSSSKVTPWIFSGTAGIFLYVALVDMLPDMLQRDPAGRKQTKTFFLRNAGFLLGTALMLCIALFEDKLQFLIVDL